MYNLTTVIRFEIVRTLKKKSFWIAALAVPVIAGLVGIIIFFSNKATDEQSANLAKEQYSVGITDDSHMISPVLLKAIKAKPIASQSAGEAAVKKGALDAYFYYPKDVSKDSVHVYGKEVGLFQDSRYQSLADELLVQSIQEATSPSIRNILKGTVNYSATTFDSNGDIDKGFLKVIAPGVFLLLFYFMIAMFGNQILTSVTEEKENRVIEMILATIKPTTLLVGKLISLIALAITQMFVILIPITIGYLLLHNQLTLPNLDLSQIPLDPMRITLGGLVFFVSFLMYTGLLMALGAAMPTAKEASSLFGAAMALLFGPLYAASLFVTAPDSLIVQILSYFPLTAPIPLLLRNAVGNLTVMQASIAIVILLATTAFILSVGVRIFRFGALEYSRKLSIKEVLRRKA
jgi:ABC-2 type transport system permease protein